MLIVKNLIVLALLTGGVGAVDPHNRNNLRASERNLYGYDSPYTESVVVEEVSTVAVEEKMKIDGEKIKGKSNIMHFSPSNQSYSKGSSNYNNHGYSKGSTPSLIKYQTYGLSKGSKGSDSSSEEVPQLLRPDRVQVKNKKTSPVTTRKPRPYKKPSWSSDGHKPPTRAPVEPIVTPEPTLWSGDAHTPQPTDWNHDGFEPIVTPQPTP
jgi:hypothetical protein